MPSVETHAQSHQCSAGHQDAGDHDAARAKAVDDPTGDESKDGTYHQFAQRVSGRDLCARPSELLHHEIVVKRQSPQCEPHDAEQDDKGGDGNLQPAGFDAPRFLAVRRAAFSRIVFCFLHR